MRTPHTAQARKGFVLIYYTFALLLLLPLMGLAVDMGMMYIVKAKLGAAVDAAALAGGRCLTRGVAFDVIKPVAEDTASRFFHANFPDKFWGATISSEPTVSVRQSSANKTMTVDISVSARVPTMFLRIAGINEATIGGGGQAVRRYLNLVLVLDRSGSIQNAADKNTVTLVRTSAKDFINLFNENVDNIGLVSYSGYVRTHFGLTQYPEFKAPANYAIDNLVFDGNTNSSAALSTAYQMLLDLNEPNARNVIVFFTDGRPSALSCNFARKDLLDTRYGTGYNRNFAPDSPYQYRTGSNPKSPCTNATVTGFAATYLGWPPPTTGATYGVLKDVWTTSGDDDDTLAPSTTDCFVKKTLALNYKSGSSSLVVTHNAPYPEAMRLDVAYIPESDRFGNSTEGYMGPLTFFSHTAPYKDAIRPDVPRNIRYTAYNTLDDAARRTRSNLNLNPVIFSIGLGGTSNEPLDDEILQRIANDPRSPIYDSSRPVGIYAKANNPAELHDAYDRVASQILRLAK